jgi:hypothetical protein
MAQSSITVETDSAYVETGNRCVLNIFTPQSAGPYISLDLSNWDSLIPQANRLQAPDPKLDEKRQGYNFQVHCVFFEEDTIVLPSIGAFDGDRYLKSNSLTLAVRAAPSVENLTDIYGLRDIRREPISLSDLLPWIIAISSAIFLILALFFWYAHKNKKQFARHRMAAKTPQQHARSRLDALVKKQLWQNGQVKPYYAELTHIYKEYLENAFGIPALESTSEDLMRLLKASTQADAQKNKAVQDFFVQADKVKFAKGVPSKDYHEQALSLVLTWIQQ